MKVSAVDDGGEHDTSALFTLWVMLKVFYCTVWRSNPTPGQSLLNLKYANGQRFAAHTPEVR